MKDFTSRLESYYNKPRHMPWRTDTRPYYILISEVMLQQTQVSRVEPKFREFVTQFPDIQALAGADLSDVLRAWSGLGYNRRAKFLWESAKIITKAFNSEIPTTVSDLVKLPGVGPNTAGAIAVYAFDRSEVFVETNIRTVILHEFFAGRTKVSDGEIKEKLAEVMDRDNPRKFYWAMMDYGVDLKKSVGNVSRHAGVYKKQSKFIDSDRQIRGAILRELAKGPMSASVLAKRIDDSRVNEITERLLVEKLISRRKRKLHLGSA